MITAAYLGSRWRKTMRYARFTFVFLLVAAIAAAQQYWISTYAGGALPLPSPAPGLQVSIGAPVSVATDSLGNVYFASLNSVFKLDRDGVLSCVAGNGRIGYSGDGGPATSAQLFYPLGVAVDSEGNRFIADSGNQRVRRVSREGIITTVAGNGSQGYSGDGWPATSAQLEVLDPKLPFARTGRIWPYVGDARHPVVVYDYTPTRGRNGPAKFLEGYTGYLQADAYSVYDAFFKKARGLVEVGCWMHARRYFFKALESDEQHMGPALHLIGRLYGVEERARDFTPDERLALRQRLSAPGMEKLRGYLEKMRGELLPKSPGARAVRYALNQWDALTRFLQDGDLQIDNGASERANRGVAVGRGNWTFFGSDRGGHTAAVLLSFVATCKGCGVEPFAWFRDVLTRIATHPVNRLAELLPHNWKALMASPA